jgi:hypothetical protein
METMTQKDKELLLKDLCGRLPYNVRVEYNGTTFTNIFDVLGIAHGRIVICLPFMSKTEYPLIEEVKPYLFPLSSITDEQWRELFKTAGYEVREEDCGRHTEMYYYDLVGHENTLYPNYDGIDWLNANHFDYRGLIEKGLAIDATGLNVY